MRYLLIDRVKRIERDKSILALKNVALSEDVFSDHFFGYPIMPGALLIECLAQAGSTLFEVSSDYQKKALLVMVHEAKFRNPVRPGDQLSVAGNVVEKSRDLARMDGQIRVESKLVATANLTFVLKDASEFYPVSMRHLVQSVYRFLLEEAELIGFPVAHRNLRDRDE